MVTHYALYSRGIEWNETYRCLQLPRRRPLERLPLRGLFRGGGWREVLRAEAEALQKLENSTVLLLELGDQVALCAGFVRKLETKGKVFKNRFPNPTNACMRKCPTPFKTLKNKVPHGVHEGRQLPQCPLHEVLLGLSESPHAAGEQVLCGAVELGELVQKLGVERLVVVARRLQLVLHAAVLESVGALLAVVVVQQLVEALLDELVRPGEHEEELVERLDDQGLRALLLLGGNKITGFDRRAFPGVGGAPKGG